MAGKGTPPASRGEWYTDCSVVHTLLGTYVGYIPTLFANAAAATVAVAYLEVRRTSVAFII